MEDDRERGTDVRLPHWTGDRGGAGRRLCRDEQRGCRATTVDTRWRGGVEARLGPAEPRRDPISGQKEYLDPV